MLQTAFLAAFGPALLGLAVPSVGRPEGAVPAADRRVILQQMGRDELEWRPATFLE